MSDAYVKEYNKYGKLITDEGEEIPEKNIKQKKDFL